MAKYKYAYTYLVEERPAACLTEFSSAQALYLVCSVYHS